MKKALFLSLLIMAQLTASAQWQTLYNHQSVVAVKVDNTTSAPDFFKAYAAQTARRGINIPEDYVLSLGQDHYGTGLVVKAHDGRYYVVTNKHTVEYARSVTILFSALARRGAMTDMPVAAIDEELDLAAIALPEDFEMKLLDIDTAIRSTRAYTFGYILTDDGHCIQGRAGTILDPHFASTELENDYGGDIIMHTAYTPQLFPGYVLCSVGESQFDRRVIGLGSRQLLSPDTIDFAIPISRVLDFVNRIRPEQHSTAAVLPTLYRRLSATAEGPALYLLPNLSHTYLFNKRAEELSGAIDSLSEECYAKFVELNELGQVENALRLLSAEQAQRDLRRAELEFNDTIVTGNRVKLTTGDKQEVVFRNEGRAWMLERIGRKSRTKAEKPEKADRSTKAPAYSTSGRRIEDLYGTTIDFKFLFPYSYRYADASFNFALGYIFKYISLEAVLEISRLMPREAALYDYRSANFVGVGLRIGGLVPIRMTEKLLLVPNVKLQLGYQTAVEYQAQYYNISGMAGLDLFVRLNPRHDYFFVGVGYEHKGLLPTAYYDLPLNHMGYITAHLGFSI